jgi:predicted dehydrogenase
MNNRLKVGVVGVGHLGRHHARILADHPDVELVGVVDSNLDRAAEIAAKHGSRAYDDPLDLVDQVDAISIAVPTILHESVATPFLDRGIAALIEKPLATDADAGRRLVELARDRGTILQVGHIERFNPIWTSIERIPHRPKFIAAERLGLYTFRSTDIGIVHDLMIHDIDLVLSTTSAKVVSVEALGVRVLSEHEDIANARIRFADGLVAELSASRVNPSAVRAMRLWGVEGFVSVDFAARKGTIIRPSERLRRGELALDLEGLDVGRPADVKERVFGRVLEVEEIEADRATEPLALELADFVSAVRSGSSPKVTGEDALRALELAEIVVAAIRAHRWEGTDEGPIGPFNLPDEQPRPIADLAGPHFWRIPAALRKPSNHQSN